MKKRIVSLLMVLIMVVSLVPAFAAGAAADDTGIPYAESTEAGRLTLRNITSDIAWRLVFPDGTRTGWSVRGEYDNDVSVIEPLDGGDYYVEVCPVSALKVVNAEEELPIYKYDFLTNVPADQIRISEKIAVAQPADEGDNIVDIAEGEVLLAPSYNAYAAFLKDNNIHDSEFDYATVKNGPAIQYVSVDGGTTWKKLTGDSTIISSAAQPVTNGVSYALYCGANTNTITLDSVKTTGTINTAPFGETVLKIKGDVSLRTIDTEQLGTLTVLGADSDAKLTVTRVILGSCIEIKDLVELKIEGTRIAINSIMGDLKLTNIPNMDIAVSSDLFPSGIRSYDGNVIFTNAFGTIQLSNDPTGKVVETGAGKKIMINADGAYVYSGADRANLHPVTLQSDGVVTGIFPADELSACLVIAKDEMVTDSYLTCTKGETCPLGRYTDVSPSAWYHDGVHYCIDKGILKNDGSGLFAPNAEVTWQQVWTALARISGKAPANAEEARQWAVEAGVADTADPAAIVTRQQFVTMLYRYAVSKGCDVSVGEDTNILSYDDAFDVAEDAIPAVQWSCGSGVMSGYDDGTLRPASAATRAQLAAFLQSFCEKVIK